jgi:hypothetical protein
MTSATASAQLDQLQLALTALRAMPHMAAQFAQNSRGGAAELLATLPPRYTAVFHNLLDRLESSALFAEELLVQPQRAVGQSATLDRQGTRDTGVTDPLLHADPHKCWPEWTHLYQQQ